MNARDALEYLDERLLEHYATPFDGIRNALATLQTCLEICESAEQTLRNLATEFLTGDGAEIAHNEAGNLYKALKGVKNNGAQERKIKAGTCYN